MLFWLIFADVDWFTMFPMLPHDFRCSDISMHQSPANHQPSRGTNEMQNWWALVNRSQQFLHADEFWWTLMNAMTWIYQWNCHCIIVHQGTWNKSHNINFTNLLHFERHRIVELPQISTCSNVHGSASPAELFFHLLGKGWLGISACWIGTVWIGMV